MESFMYTYRTSKLEDSQLMPSLSLSRGRGQKCLDHLLDYGRGARPYMSRLVHNMLLSLDKLCCLLFYIHRSRNSLEV